MTTQTDSQTIGEKTQQKTRMTSTHWGAYRIAVRDDRIVDVQPFEDDPLPSAIGYSIPEAVHHRCRVMQPMVRRGWLENGPGDAGGKRGREPFVAVSWEKANALLAGELARVRDQHGNQAIFGGSYGWASAGRFHHAQSQVHRFLNCLGGYTYSVNSYSTAAAQVIVPHVLGEQFLNMMWHNVTSWPVIAEHTELLVMFGGIGTKNAQVSMGGVTRHDTGNWLKHCHDKGVKFVNVSPLATDSIEQVAAQWLPIRPNTDVAFMLGLAYVLETEGLADQAFLGSHCQGYERFRAYLSGVSDGIPKTPEWAAEICGIDAATTAKLARKMAATRCLITVSWSLQRGDHGEQPYWMAATLAAMLGQIGLPGGGVGFGYGAIGGIGNPVKRLEGMSLPQGTNPVNRYIPVARIADLLLHPGEQFDYDGKRLTYPDIKLVYWCGGNPFHHHQDLHRLREAWQKPETIVVHEPWWTATAKHADIVLPAATPWERNDIGRAGSDAYLIAMQQMVSPVGESQTDYQIFSALAQRLGFEEAFTEGRDEHDWLEYLYGRFRQQLAEADLTLPGFDEFWQAGHIELPVEGPEHATVPFTAFRADPKANPLKTPSGLVEIFSATIDSFGYDDCRGHPTWLEPAEWLGAPEAKRYPLHLISPQPATRLHSQLDCGTTSREAKVQGREVALLNPADASARGITDGDVIRLFNDRGDCLAAARVSAEVMPGVVALPTGAWFDPEDDAGDDASLARPLERHGNPNTLTLDKGTSRLGQGSSAHTALVEVELFEAELPTILAHEPPAMVTE